MPRLLYVTTYMQQHVIYRGSLVLCIHPSPSPGSSQCTKSTITTTRTFIQEKKYLCKKQKKLEVKGVSGTYGNYIIRRVCYPIDKITKHYQDSSQITEHCVFTRDSCIPRLSLLPIVDTLISSWYINLEYTEQWAVSALLYKLSVLRQTRKGSVRPYSYV